MKSSSQGSELRRPKLRIFNPSRLSDEELEASFIARGALYEKLLTRIINEQKGHVPQHHLIVGQRGMGKTTLLCRIAVELRKSKYHERYIPLQFPEEQYIEIDRLSKFWLNCLDSLADALEEKGNETIVEEIEAKIHSLHISDKNEGEVARKAQKLFSTIVEAIKRRPVLLFDNFHLILERLKEEDYSLRAFFMRENAPILIGASTVMPIDTNDYGAAFYDAFMIHLLHQLSLEEMQSVLKQLAKKTKNNELFARIQCETPRLATLRDLTGGNPRTTVLLFELFARGFSQDAYEDLESLLDHMTPLYQSRLIQLSEQSQLVLGALARNWSPTSAQQLTKMIGLPRGSISTQLNRLEAIGMVEKVTLSKGKKPGYQVAERFFNIWYLMRFSVRRQRSSLIFLTRFLQEFYTPTELHQRAFDLMNKEGQLSKGELAYTMALAETDLDTPTVYKLREYAETLVVQEDAGLHKHKQLAPIVNSSKLSEDISRFEETRLKLKKGVIESGAAVDPDEFVDLVMGSFDLLPPFKPNRLDLIEKSMEAKEVESLYSKIKKRNSRSPIESPVSWIEERLKRGLITRWDNAEQIQNALDATDDLAVCAIFSNIFWSLAAFELVVKSHEAALKIKPDLIHFWHELALIYRDCMNDPQKARDRLSSVTKMKINPADIKSDEFIELADLHEALFASLEQNWGQVRKHLANALDSIEDASSFMSSYNFYWVCAVLLHQGYGTKLVNFLDDEGWNIRTMPAVEAIRAHALENRRHLLDIPQESREAADEIYGYIEKIRQWLPESTRDLFTI